MNKNIKNQNGGFIQLIVFIIVLLIILKFTGFSISGLYNWFMSYFGSVLR